jgi:tritrans,polycis-undecaprenyl-diphosphate synthase [geranylgeranyl-diphosphate specific]
MRSLKSIAIIPDGNRRYAKKSGLALPEAYAAGFEKVKSVFEWSKEEGLESATFWALSLDNLRKRSKTELDVVLGLLGSRLDGFLSKGFDEARINFFGRLEELPDGLREKFAETEERTKKNQGFELNFAVAYGGRDELFHAAESLARDYASGSAELSQKEFEKRLYLPREPDLVVRTGSAQRLSGFLPWQNEYSELFFSEKLWPEFSRADFDEALGFYSSSESRRGR